MHKPAQALATELLAAYQSGVSVEDLISGTGLNEDAVVRRLCAASRVLAHQGWTCLDHEGALGVQWEFVFWRG